jgi:transposase
VHVKTLRSQKLRMLLTHRKLLQSKAIAIENDLRGTLRNFGLKVGMVGKVKFEARIWVDSLKALDPERPIREADIVDEFWHFWFVPTSDSSSPPVGAFSDRFQ